MSKAPTKEKEPELFQEPKAAPAKNGREVANPKVEKVSTAVAVHDPAAAAKNTAANTLAVIAQALKDPTFKPESMKMVLDMHKEMVAEQARIDYINAFHAMKAALPSIDKDGRIVVLEKGADGKRVEGRDRVQQSTPFATYDNIRAKVDPILARFGFTMWDETQPSPDGSRILVVVHLDHNSGHGRQTAFPLPAETSGSKNNVQGWGSAFSYGRRYGAVGILGLRTVAPGDVDRDGHDAPAIEEGDDGTLSFDEASSLSEAIKASGLSFDKFCQKYGIKAVNMLPRTKLEEAKQAVAAFAETARRARKAKAERR